MASLAAILTGTALLWLPITHAGGQPVSLLTALFTAVSALCTTGLSPVNIARAYNPLGLVIILLLVQLGGLGLLTVSFWFALLYKGGDSVRQRLGVVLQLNLDNVGDVRGLVRRILRYVLVIEGVGALLMLPTFVAQEGWGRGLLYAALHAVMAFNNAGFAVYDDGLARFSGHAPLLLCLGALIVLGGLGFASIDNLLAHWRDRRRVPLRTNTKIGLVMTAALIVLGTLALLALEWGRAGTLGDLPAWQRPLSALFQSISSRSAGFNSIDLGQLSGGSLLAYLLLMFVGTDPNSTGGGIKTTTAFVLLAFTWALVRGRGSADAFGRRISVPTLLRAVAVLTLGLLAASLGSLALLLTDPGLPPLKLVFEAVSAFGTAGMSANITPQLSPAGQLVLIVLMFLGRVGLLTLLLAFGERRPALIRAPEEKSIIVG